MKEESIKRNKLDIAIVIVLMIIFALIWIGIVTGVTDEFDNFVNRNIEAFRVEPIISILATITEFGGVFGMMGLLAIVDFVLVKNKKFKEAGGITLNLVISTFIYVILKNVFQRPRPEASVRLIDETGFSFPSGHTTNNVAFYSFLIYLVCMNVKNKKLRNVLCVIFTMIPVVIAFSRIHLRVHYPTDVLAGFCLGISITILFVKFVYVQIKK